jgi:hypothetical protein
MSSGWMTQYRCLAESPLTAGSPLVSMRAVHNFDENNKIIAYDGLSRAKRVPAGFRGGSSMARASGLFPDTDGQYRPGLGAAGRADSTRREFHAKQPGHRSGVF